VVIEYPVNRQTDRQTRVKT